MLEKTKNPRRKRGETRANGRRSLDGEFSCVVSGVFSAEMRVCRSNWNSCGCFFDLDSDQAASSIHVANDRNTTGKCWEGRGWLEQLPADTGQVTNSSQGWQIAAAYTDSFYTFFYTIFYVGRIFTVRQQTLSWEKSDLDSTKLHRFNTTGHKTPAQRRRKRNNHTRIQEIQHR